ALVFDVDAGNLPAQLTFVFHPDSDLSIVTSGILGRLAARLENPNGLPGSGALLDVPLKHAQFRVDQVPSLHATWSSGASTAVNFDTDVAGVPLGGVQVSVSTVFMSFVCGDPAAQLPGPTPSTSDYLRFSDDGAAQPTRALAAGIFDILHFSYASADPSHGIALQFAATTARPLQVNIDSRFGKFFHLFDLHVALVVQNVP